MSIKPLFINKIIKNIRQGTLIFKLKKNYFLKLYDKMFGVSILNDKIKSVAIENINTQMKVEVFLNKYFNNFIVFRSSISNEYIKTAAKLIVNRRKHKMCLERYNGFLNETKLLKPELFSYKKWKDITYLFINNGLFKASILTRDKIIKKAYSQDIKKRCNFEYFDNAFKAFVDQSDFDKAKEAIDVLSKILRNKNEIDQYRIYYLLLKGDKESALTITKNMYSEYDKQYDKYLKGKNVAIVGPAFSGYSAGNEIDSFDVVVRIFYRGKSYLPDPEKQGSKVDVSYYNVKCAEMISEGSDYTFFQDLDYAVFKENKHSYQKKLFDADNGRVLFSPNRFLLNGSANMIPLVLYDLLNFNINKIKIFNVNLYLTTHNTYFPGYQIEEKSKKNFTPSWYAFAVHNPMTQFNFIKNLWRTGLIDVDQACENVISMSSQEYMNAMEDIYVNTNPMS